MHHETVPRNVFFPGRDLHVTTLLWRVAEERLAWVQTHVLRRTKVFGMTENSDAGLCALPQTADVTPFGARGVALHPVRDPLTREKVHVGLAVPIPVSAEAKSAIVIFWKL